RRLGAACPFRWHFADCRPARDSHGLAGATEPWWPAGRAGRRTRATAGAVCADPGWCATSGAQRCELRAHAGRNPVRGLFGRLYVMTLRWAAHRRAPWLLACLSFAESSFFPIPPDVMLAPMVLAKPKRAWALAALTTVASVLGGLFGYLLGHYALEFVLPLLERFQYMEHYNLAQSWFERWGFWIILVFGGFSPIPYKLFTI